MLQFKAIITTSQDKAVHILKLINVEQNLAYNNDLSITVSFTGKSFPGATGTEPAQVFCKVAQ